MQVVLRGPNEGWGLDHRTIHGLSGPRIVFMAGGKLGWFDMNNLLIEVATALVHLAIAALVVDWVMLHVVPDTQFSQFKYRDTEHTEVVYSRAYSNPQGISDGSAMML